MLTLMLFNIKLEKKERLLTKLSSFQQKKPHLSSCPALTFTFFWDRCYLFLDILVFKLPLGSYLSILMKPTSNEIDTAPSIMKS